MSRNFLLLCTLTALLATDALAAFQTNGPRARVTAQPPPPPAQQPPNQPAPPASLDEACGDQVEDPFSKLEKPRIPTAPARLRPDTAKLTDDDINGGEIKFDRECTKTRAATDAASDACDKTLAAVLKYYRDEHTSFKDLRTQLCEDAKKKAKDCVGQTDALACSARIYKEVGDSFRDLKKRLDGKIEMLRRLQMLHRDTAKKELELVITPPPPARGRDASDPLIVAARNYLSQDATTGLSADRVRQLLLCRRTTQVAEQFCEHIVSATDSAYFAKGLSDTSTISGRLAAKFDKLAADTQQRAERQGPPGSDPNNPNNPNDPNARKSGLLGGMGLDDVLKLATLGMTGAGMYCSMTGKCGSQNQQQQAGSEPLGGATSPTPNSPAGASGPEKSSMGDTPKGGSPVSPIGDGTKTDTGTGGTNFGGNGGFGGSSMDPLSSHFNGNLDTPRGPASTPASSGAAGGGSGGGGGGGGGGGLEKGAQPVGDLPKALDGIGTGVGGGGLAGPGGGGGGGAAGGFNLGDSHNPSDTALKNILNGEPPPGGDPALDPLGGTAASPDGGGASLGMDDPESLFSRVRGTHVRCQKRGCVGREVGDNI